MKKLALILMALFFLSGTTASVVLDQTSKKIDVAQTVPQVPTETSSSPLRVLRMGDSRTIGIGSTWGTGYAPEFQRLMNQAGVAVDFGDLNAGTGWDIRDLRNMADQVIAQTKPDLIILAVGTNNAAGSCGNPPCLGMANIDQNYLDLVLRLLIDAPDAKLIITEIQYSSTPWAINEVYVNVAAIRASWNEACRNRCARANLQGISRCGGLGSDSVHPSDTGYMQMADELARVALQQQGVTVWPMKIPMGGPRPGFEVPNVRAPNGC